MTMTIELLADGNFYVKVNPPQDELCEAVVSTVEDLKNWVEGTFGVAV